MRSPKRIRVKVKPMNDPKCAGMNGMISLFIERICAEIATGVISCGVEMVRSLFKIRVLSE